MQINKTQHAVGFHRTFKFPATALPLMTPVNLAAVGVALMSSAFSAVLSTASLDNHSLLIQPVELGARAENLWIPPRGAPAVWRGEGWQLLCKVVGVPRFRTALLCLLRCGLE